MLEGWMKIIDKQFADLHKRRKVEALEYSVMTDLEIAQGMLAAHQECAYKEGTAEHTKFDRDRAFWKEIVRLLKKDGRI